MELKDVKLTVIKRDNQNPGFEYKTDTIFNSDTIDLTRIKIDPYFCYVFFRIPYHMPSNGIFRDSLKAKECNWSIYPRQVKCYEYDNKNRVSKMQIESSGTTAKYLFTYDKEDKIIAMSNYATNYKITYNNHGNLLKMKVIGPGGVLKKTLRFKYRKR